MSKPVFEQQSSLVDMKLSQSVLLDFDIIDIVGLSTLFIGIFIYMPIIIYYLIKFHKHYADKTIMKYRNKSLIYTINILSIIILTIDRTYLCLASVINMDKYIYLPTWPCYLASSISFWIIFLLFFIKTYLLYFEQQYHLSMINITWKKQINPGIEDWYIKQRQSGFGSFKYLLKISVIPYIIIVCIEAFGENFFGDNLIFNIVHLIIIGIPLISSFVIFCKTKSFNDHYRIRREILYQIIIISIFIIFHVIFFILYSLIIYHTFNIDQSIQEKEFNTTHFINIFAIDPDQNNDIKYKNILRLKWLIYILITQCLLLSIALLSTAYPINVHKKSELLKAMNRSRNNSKLTQSIKNTSASSKMQEMALTISHTKGFKLFMQHLVKYIILNIIYLILTLSEHHHVSSCIIMFISGTRI